MRYTRAIARPPGTTYSDGLTTSTEGPPDLPRALEQHAGYVRALAGCGLQVDVLPADERHPDAPFVEDTAVIAPRVAIVTRPGAPSRAGEIESIAPLLAGLDRPLARIDPPGTLDGGDVCQADELFLVGVSGRTNEEGARQFASIVERHGYRATLVDVRAHRALLHLKSGLTYLGDGRFLGVRDFPRAGLPERAEFVAVDDDEAYAANALRVNETLLVARGYPRVAESLDRLGYRLRTLDVSEFRKLDGGLSCLSLRF